MSKEELIFLTKEELILRQMEICTSSINGKCPNDCPLRQVDFCTRYIIKDALKLLKLLKTQEVQEPRAITPEEVLKANPVWFETHGLISPAIIDHGESKAGFCVIVFGADNWNDYPIDQYNKTWRCWTARPTEEEKRAVKWDD